MKYINFIFLIISSLLIQAGSQLVVAQNSNIDIAKLQSHIKLKNSFVGEDAQRYIDAVSRADFEQYRHPSEIRLIKFVNGVEFMLIPLDGNIDASINTTYNSSFKLSDSGHIAQLVLYAPSLKTSKTGNASPSSSGSEIQTFLNEVQSDKKTISVSEAPKKTPVKINTNERIIQLENMRQKAIDSGSPVNKYDKAIEELRKKLKEQNNSE